MNQLVIEGYVAEDSIKHGPAANGTYLRFRIKERVWDKQNGVRYTTWNVVCFGKAADSALRYLKDGSFVLVYGSLKVDVVEKPDASGDVKKNYFTKIMANTITIPRVDDAPQASGGKPSSFKLPSAEGFAEMAVDDDDIPF